MKREELQLHILAVLERNEAHGYEIAKTLEKEGKKVSWGHLYPLLGEMEERGLITGKKVGRKKEYTITEKGQKWFQDHLRDVRSGTVPVPFPSFSWLAKDLQEIFVIRRELQGVLKNLFRIIASREESKITKVTEILQKTRKEMEKLVVDEKSGDL